jgi:hypothetical protein
MQAASIADEVLIQLGQNVQMYIGTRAKPNIRVNLYKGATAYPAILTITSIFIRIYIKKKTISTHMLYT